MEKKRNLWVILTDKPSRLFKTKSVLVFDRFKKVYSENFKKLGGYINQHIYITSDEEIKEGDWFYDLDTEYLSVKLSWENSHLGFNGKKIILTTDQDLIKDGVQAIGDEFLEWFVKNPSCKEVVLKEINRLSPLGSHYGFEGYKIIIPKEEPKQVGIDWSGFPKSTQEKVGYVEPKQKWDINTCRYWDMEIGCEREKCICENTPLEEHDYLQGFINQFQEDGEHQELSNDDWTVSRFLEWLKHNNFKINKRNKNG